jgi:diguanylate cyclase (GGDEF)-like protein
VEPVRVLFVEDEDSEVELAAHQLRANHIAHVVQRVATEDAMRAQLKAFRPTIILSDFSMPGFSGLRALEIAREVAPDIPFVFVSGTIGEERAIEALRRGAVDYVLKSNLSRLGPVVRRALAEAEAKAVAKTQEREIARLTSVLRMLSGINSAVARIRERQELLQEASRLAVTVGGYGGALVALRHAQTRALEPQSWDGIDQERAVRLCEVIAKRVTREIRAGRVSVEAPVPIEFSRSEGWGGGRMVALPLVVDKTVIGVMAVWSGAAGQVGEDEMRMLREVAANVSFALQYLQQDNRVKLLSYFDVLTGLAKRTLFCQRAQRLLGSGRCIVAVVDIEDLGAVNNSFGRHAGDHLLQLLSDRLKRGFVNTEYLGQLAGGTFAIVQPVPGTMEASLRVLDDILDQVFTQPFAVEGKDVPVGARSGIAVYPEDAGDAEGLVEKAEAALRAARQSGDRRGYFNAQQYSARLAGVALERRLRVAVERQQFELHYQPKVDVKTRCIEGVEALIRWRDPDSGLVAPGAFLPILESSGLIVALGEWVIERAALDCRHWQQLGLPGVRVAVNISPLQLRHGDLVGCVLEHIHGWSSAECGLDVEITEGALAEDSAAGIATLERLRAAGVKVAIDDFGTGYSSLGRLERLPIDTLKIDRSFVLGISTTRGKKLVAIMISLARAFGLTVVAEGVEHQFELDALWELGCDQSQGFLHSKPVSQEAFAELLAHGNGRFILPKEPSETEPRGIPVSR